MENKRSIYFGTSHFFFGKQKEKLITVSFKGHATFESVLRDDFNKFNPDLNLMRKYCEKTNTTIFYQIIPYYTDRYFKEERGRNGFE